MKLRRLYLSIILTLLAFGQTVSASPKDPDIVAKHVRNYVTKGNEAYRANDYAKAETFYRDALQEDRNSSVALFNLALTLLRKNGNPLANKGQDQNTTNEGLTNPADIFNEVITLNRDENLVASSFYNLGNMYFDAGNYAESIQHYKNVLRRDPSHMKARQNLRVAQMKLEEQKQDQNNQNQNQQNQKNQNNNQDNKDNNQKNNENKANNPDNNKKDEEQKQQGQDNAKQNQQPPQQKSDGGTSSGRQAMSKENSDKILESVKKSEEQTRKKVEQRKANQTTRRTTDRPW